ncbi:hypothetical protein M153_8900000239 [Pseudoloma neurophilia]|uniref:Ricin B lectin domain-containing protein n=1 Tax=Pseudoloma neurophilia TaxID=146866 RepID=A0A0R0LXV3_9MICR|nr:hypothetical protein M153_8900000239 [Pseudoloma neurophilia]
MFFIVHFHLIRSFKFLLKKFDADLYFGKPGATVTYTEFANADILEVQKTGVPQEDFIVVTTKNNHVVDVAGGTNEIIYWPQHGGKNQRFRLQFRPHGRYKLQNDSSGYCIAFNSSANKFIVTRCIENDEMQEFILQPINKDEEPKDKIFIPVNRARLEALKRAALQCDEIKDEMGAEAIAELGETEIETEARFKEASLKAMM